MRVPCTPPMLAPWPLPNVWEGTTVENAAALPRVADLLATPAAVRFLSCEPLLGPLDLDPPHCEHCNDTEEKVWSEAWCCCDSECVYRGWLDGPLPTIDWVICGAESGTGARPMSDDWMRSIRDQCQAAGVPYFGKQRTVKGRPIPFEAWPSDLQVKQMPEVRNG